MSRLSASLPIGGVSGLRRLSDTRLMCGSPADSVSRRLYSSHSESIATEPETHRDTPRLEKPDFLNEAESVIWDRLVLAFAPTDLLVQDISGGCGSMYGIEVASEKFRGTNMLKQQRMVNSILGDLMKDWHGVQLKTRVP